jgi:hypothetical protein
MSKASFEGWCSSFFSFNNSKPWNYPYIKKEKKFTNETKIVTMIDDVFEKLDLFIIQQVSPPLLSSPMSPIVVLFPRNTFHGGHNYQQLQ